MQITRRQLRHLIHEQLGAVDKKSKYAEIVEILSTKTNLRWRVKDSRVVSSDQNPLISVFWSPGSGSTPAYYEVEVGGPTNMPVSRTNIKGKSLVGTLRRAFRTRLQKLVKKATDTKLTATIRVKAWKFHDAESKMLVIK
mgnify:CR=1 FL=1